MNNSSLKFQYKMPIGQFIIISIMMFAVSFGLAYIATSNTKGIKLLSVIRLNPENATLFLWGLSALSCVFAVMVLVTTIKKNITPQVVSIERGYINAPKASFLSKTLSHPISEITNLGHTIIAGQEFYIIKSPIGTSKLMPKAFKDLTEYQQFENEITKRING